MTTAVSSLGVKKELARFLLQQVKEQRLEKSVAVAFLKELAEPPDPALDDVAIIGMACRFPMADSKEAFWDNLYAGRHAMRPFPPHRRADLAGIDSGRSELFSGGFLENVDEFDNDYFRIPPNVARHMDPYQRLFMETLVETIEDAGYHRGAFHGRPVGVFAGNDHTHRLFNSYLDFIDQPDFNSVTGSWTGVLASRLSYLFNLKGPAVVVDTSCSSGLVALDYAIKALRAGDCEAALVGAANIFFAPGKGIVGEIENDDAQVRAFDQRAKGTVWGEGVAAILVKPLAHALRDRDHVYAVVKGIAVNNDGASNGLTAPNAKAQQEVILKAWERARIDPQDLSYIETHGTGTHLGDPIEIKGLVGAFSRHSARKQFCGIGSVKTNIGHTVGVAGLASLIKVLLSLERSVLPPSLNFDQPNPFIDFCNSPVYVNDRPTDWRPADKPRLAAVSSFSLSGTNCHVVLQEAPPREKTEAAEDGGPQIFPISARSNELLAVTLRRYLDWCGADNSIDLADACYTAAVGREHHAVRAALVVESTAELCAALAALLEAVEGGSDPLPQGRIFYSSTSEGVSRDGATLDRYAREALAEFLQRKSIRTSAQLRTRSLAQLASLYTAGATVKWQELYQGEARRRVGLPAQPFLRSRFWDKAPGQVGASKAGGAAAAGRVPQLDAAELLAIVQREEPRVAGIEGMTEPLPYKAAAYVWSEVLGYPKLELTDDFYALGGDSITGIRIVHLFNAVFGLDLGLTDLLGAPTLAQFVRGLIDKHDFAGRIGGADSGGERRGAQSPIEVLPQAFAYRLSRAQQRMFLLDRLSPGSTIYNVNAVVRMDEMPDVQETEAIIDRILQRHEILRSGFELRDGNPVQVVHAAVPFAIEYFEVEGCGTPQEDEEALRRVVRGFIRAFDISRPPLVRVAFVKAPGGACYMVIDMHHIVTDGSSMGVLIRDYFELKSGASLAPLPFQYKDFAAWQNRQFESGDYQRHAQYWKDRYAGGIPVLDLCTDYPRPAVQDFRGSKEHFTIGAELAASLRSLARAQGATLFMVLLAALKVLLYKLGGGQDLVVGTPVTGRSRLELEALIGMFVNTLPLRDRIEAQDPFDSFLASVKANTLSAMAHQDYPYEELLEVLEVPRSAGRNALFDVYFVLQNEDMGLGRERGVSAVEAESTTAKFDMTVVARDTGDGIAIEWEYAVSLYKASTIRRIGGQLLQLLGKIAANPAVPVADLDLLSDLDHRRIVEDYNATATAYPGAKGIAALFEEIVRGRPDAIAVEMDGVELTYGELNARASRLAHLLLRQGVQRGQPVALLFERSLDMMVAILAVLKAGAAYVPLDLDNPPERTEGILADTGVRILLAGRDIAIPEQWGVTTIRPEALDLSALPCTDPGVAVNGEDLAYIIFTSGSTGRPKGTLIRQKSVIRVVRDTNYICLQPSDVFLQLSNYAFDGSVFDMFGALLNGGRLVLLHKREVIDMDTLARIIRERGVTVFFVTTALFNVLVDTKLDSLAGVRHILFGGEAASIKHVATAFRALGPGRLIHVYGPTETTVFATGQVIHELDDGLGAVPIGGPIANTHVYVLDERGQPVPHGVVGELYIGGDGVALGYLNRDELTAERFVPDPFRNGPPVYRSGDLVKWLADGSIQFLGRRDHQVKIRGFRIELGEVETAILRHASVKECLVTADPDASGRKQLCAYVVPADFASFSADELRAFLGSSLPDYMVPHAIVALPVFPLNANGKVDRSALAAVEPLARPAAATVAARDAREAALAGVWAAVLAVPEPGMHDNFFASGGDSIKAIQVVARLQALGYAVRMPLLFQHQTIAELAPHLVEMSSGPAEQGPVTGALPLNPIQSWFLSSTGNEPHHFNQSMYVELPSLPSSEAMRKAAQSLCAHHDALRTAFRHTADGWQAFVREPAANAFRIFEYEGEAWEPGTPATDRQLLELQTSLGLEEGPLMAIGLFRVARGAGVCIAVHHLVVDVVSWNVLLEDFETCLAAAQTGQAPALPPKTASFIAWNRTLHEYAQGGQAKASLPYWTRLAERPCSEIHSRSLPAGTVADARTETLLIDAHSSSLVMGAANRAYATEPQHLLLSALGRALTAWRGGAQHLLMLEGHGRDGLREAPDVGRTVGWFTCAFPFAVPYDEERGAAIKATKEALRSVPAKGLDYGVLTYLTPGLTDGERAALSALTPQVGFNFLGNVDAARSRDGVRVHALSRAITTSHAAQLNLGMDIVAACRDGRIELEVLFDPTRLSQADVRHFLDLVREQLVGLALHCVEQATPEKTASDFTVTKLSQDELADIFSDLEIL